MLCSSIYGGELHSPRINFKTKLIKLASDIYADQKITKIINQLEKVQVSTKLQFCCAFQVRMLEECICLHSRVHTAQFGKDFGSKTLQRTLLSVPTGKFSIVMTANHYLERQLMIILV